VIGGSHIVTALQTIVSRNVKPVDTAVVSVTRFHAGDAYNVIPEQVQIGGTVRAFETDTLTLIQRNMKRIASGVASGLGATAKVDFRVVALPLINNATETAFIVDTASELVGLDNVDRDSALVMASEDFSYMLSRSPGAYIRIGNGDEPGACQVHNPGYDFNDAILPLGASLFVRLAERKLARGWKQRFPTQLPVPTQPGTSKNRCLCPIMADCESGMRIDKRATARADVDRPSVGPSCLGSKLNA
jgi:hippurate hydrolase